MRAIWVKVHRWAGLALALPLIVVGLTGSVLAFYLELDELINPRLFQTQRGPELPPAELALRAQDITGLRAERVFVGVIGAAAWVRVAAPEGQPAPKFAYLRLDPVSGKEIARQNYGLISEGFGNLMQFIYRLHYELALGTIGFWALGICAVVWTLDSFVGFYLTLPPAARPGPTVQTATQSRWRRWGPAWRVRTDRGPWKLNFDLHRAGGLWLWLVLLVFAWSSVYLNLGATVYPAVMRLVSDYRNIDDVTAPPAPPSEPRLDWRDAQRIGDELLAEQGRLLGFSVEHPVSLEIDPSLGLYHYVVRTSLEIQDHRGVTRLSFDAVTGELRQLLLPAGQHRGNTFTNWIYALHTGNVFGLPYRIFVSVFGLAVVVLSGTGAYIWWKKRSARRFIQRRA